MTESTSVSANKPVTNLERLLELPACTLITTGRTGSDFFQSLLDSHPQVLTFNGYLLFQSFWASSRCVAAGKFDTSDLIDEFIGKHIQTLKSRYDLIERKNELGEGLNQSVDIDLEQFRTVASELLKGQETNSKTVLVAFYSAYAVCLGQDLSSKRLFFHHVHTFKELPLYLRDFPDSKIVCMTRDPRANFVSGIENHRDNNFFWDADTGVHLYFYINRILNDSTPLAQYGNEYTSIRVEDLGSQGFVERVCHWLGIDYDDCMTKSTWAGLAWHGDALSQAKKVDGRSRDILDNRWQSRLSRTDKYVLNYVMNNRLRHYGYPHKPLNILDVLITPWLIMLPLSYEARFISPKYLRNAIRLKRYRKLASNLLAYGKRVLLFMRFYMRVTRGEKFQQPFISDR